MDFDPVYRASHGGQGEYLPLDPQLLPPHLYLLYSQQPSESGKVRSSNT